MVCKSPIVTLVTPASTPRLEYVIHHIFHEFLGVGYRISSSIPMDNTLVLYYGGEYQGMHKLCIPSHGLLSRSRIDPIKLDIIKEDELFKAFLVSDSDELSFDFDLFSWLFYLLSRYEEYHNDDLDQHGRFKSTNSLASQHGFLEMPLVDLWILKLTQEIEKVHGVNLWSKRSSKLCPSIDIDMPYAYHKKGYRAYLGVFRDIITLNLGGVRDRLSYFTSGSDPFDTYKDLMLLLESHPDTYIFLLCNYNPPHDLNHIADSIEWQYIVEELKSWAQLGIHPSYQSHNQVTQLKLEKEKLENLVGPVSHSRQHFLKFQLPDTYRNLLSQGIKHDHSMLYPDQMGFRASTSRPFLWYDLENDRSTDLLIHPYTIMDVTMRYYMGLTPQEAIVKIDQLKSALEPVDGDLSFLWHNSSMSRAYGWKKWMPVLHHLLRNK